MHSGYDLKSFADCAYSCGLWVIIIIFDIIVPLLLISIRVACLKINLLPVKQLPPHLAPAKTRLRNIFQLH